jgi:excisionase family DNA binding protein
MTPHPIEPLPLTMDALRRRTTVTLAETATVLGIGTSTAYRMAQAGELPTVRLGSRSWRVSAPALIALLEQANDPGLRLPPDMESEGPQPMSSDSRRK